MKTIFASTIVLLAAAVAQAHVHIAVAANDAGTGLQFRLYGDDTATITPDGHFATAGTNVPIVTPLDFVTNATPFAGYATGPSPTITTDYYSRAGGPAEPPVFAGADVWLELTAVTPVAGGARADNVGGFSIPQGDFSYQDAISNAATLADRSVDLGRGNHFHGTSLYSLYGGTYDLTLVAHDLRASGTRLADSTPFVLRLSAVPEPGMLGGLIGMAALARRRRSA